MTLDDIREALPDVEATATRMDPGTAEEDVTTALATFAKARRGDG